jgi:hypothetical protein
MGFDRKQLKESLKPFYDFDGKKIEPVEAITLLLSFGTPKNPLTEYITSVVVDMTYPYNAIFGRGLLNIFDAALYSAYLCLKVPTTFRVRTIFDSHQEARNIEKGFPPGHKNVHFLQEQQERHEAQPPTECRKFIEVEGEFRKVSLDQRVPDKTICINTDKNSNVFAWSTSVLVGVKRDIIEHQLQVDPNVKLKKQKLHKMADEKIQVAKAGV